MTTRSKPGEVQEEHTLLFTEDGKVATWWWTLEIDQILLTLGTRPKKQVGMSNYCG